MSSLKESKSSRVNETRMDIEMEIGMFVGIHSEWSSHPFRTALFCPKNTVCCRRFSIFSVPGGASSKRNQID